MVCVYCGAKTRVINSRLQRRSNSTWRRRKCGHCAAIFSTSEHADYEKTWVVQYPDGALSPFVRDKLFISIHKSLQHRPTALNNAIGLTATVINNLHKNTDDGALKTKDIANTVLIALKRFDQPAATSYQAFHTDIV